MSGLSTLSPIEQRDFRSTSTKRSRDHTSKWSMGARPPLGGYWNEDGTIGGPEGHKGRPVKVQGSTKSHQNKNTAPSSRDLYAFGTAVGRMDRTITAHQAATEATSSPLTKSLFELLPPDVRSSSPSIQTVPADVDVLYSFDHRGVSPGIKASEVHLGGLVEEAEKKWVSQMTEKIVRGEYEVLDERGEKTSLGNGKGRGKRSPKQKAAKNEPAPTVDAEDEDGFEFI